MFTSCSELIYDSMNSNLVKNCRDNPNHSARRECEMNLDKSFSQYEEEIKRNESSY